MSKQQTPNPFPHFKKLSKDVIEMFKKKRYDECLEAVEKILRRDPHHATALTYRGIIAYERKGYKAALRDFNFLCKLEPKFPFSWNYVSKIHIYLKQYGKARAALKKEMFLVPDPAEPWCMYALTRFLEGNEGAAFGILDYMEPYIKENQMFSYLRGIMHEKMGNKDEALVCFLENQMKLSPKDKYIPASKIYDLVSNTEN